MHRTVTAQCATMPNTCYGLATLVLFKVVWGRGRGWRLLQFVEAVCFVFSIEAIPFCCARSKNSVTLFTLQPTTEMFNCKKGTAFQSNTFFRGGGK